MQGWVRKFPVILKREEEEEEEEIIYLKMKQGKNRLMINIEMKKRKMKKPVIYVKKVLNITVKFVENQFV